MLATIRPSKTGFDELDCGTSVGDRGKRVNGNSIGLPPMYPAFTPLLFKLPVLSTPLSKMFSKISLSPCKAFMSPVPISHSYYLHTNYKPPSLSQLISFRPTTLFTAPVAISTSRPAPVSASQPAHAPARRLPSNIPLSVTPTPVVPTTNPFYSSMTSTPLPVPSAPPPQVSATVSSDVSSPSSSVYDSHSVGLPHTHASVTTTPPATIATTDVTSAMTAVTAAAVALDVDPFDTSDDKRCRPRGHRHSAESRRKIGLANRGNVPWNKGRPHSEETKRKIAENTRRAMLRPELRQILKQRAIGRRHSEETKLKIRHTARLVRGGARPNKIPKRAVPFAFTSTDMQSINQSINVQMDELFTKDDETQKLVVHPKRSMSEQTKQKLSQRIKEMWADPVYRSKVSTGIEANKKKRREQKFAAESILEHAQDQSLVDHDQHGRQHPSLSSSPKKRSRSSGSNCQGPLPFNAITPGSDIKEEVREEYDEDDYWDNEKEEASASRVNPVSGGMLHGLTREDLGIVDFDGEGLIPGYSGEGSDALPRLTSHEPSLSSADMHDGSYSLQMPTVAQDEVFHSKRSEAASSGNYEVIEVGNVSSMRGTSIAALSEESYHQGNNGFDDMGAVPDIDSYGALDLFPANGDLDSVMKAMHENNREMSLGEDTTGQDDFENSRNLGSPFYAVPTVDDEFASPFPDKYEDGDDQDAGVDDQRVDINKLNPSDSGDAFSNPFNSLDGF